MNYKQKRKSKTSSSQRKGGINMKDVMLVGAGITATGIVGYFGYQYYKKLKEEQEQQAKKTLPVSTFTPPITDTPIYQPNPSNSETSYTKNENNHSSKEKTYTDYSNSNTKNETPTWTAPKPKSEFPLKRGSKGVKVKNLQLALIATYGKSILPNYGADGDFGKELANGLKKLKYPATVSESLYNVITGGNASQTSLAKQLYTTLNKYDYKGTMALLKQIIDKADYSSVSNEFKTFRLHGGVRQTLVNATLNSFSDATQKQNIRLEFIRMGLKYNGNKWSLDGIGGVKIITTVPTQIWLDGYSSMQVPQNMILGMAHAEKLDFTLFENENRFFLVRTKDVKRIT